MTRTQIGIMGGIVFVILLFALGFLCIIPGVFTKCSGEPPPPKKTKLEFWGVFDDSEIYESLIKEYRSVRPNVTITYRKIRIDDYERTLINEFAANRGPDIWYIHNTWLPKHFDKIAPMPQKTAGVDWPIDLLTYPKNFVDVAYQDFVREDRIFALPLFVDTLALYYNRDLLASAGIEKPADTWEKFLDDVERLTQRDALGRITRSGATLGTARNINRSVDILWLLMLQGGTEMINLSRGRATFTKTIKGSDGASFSPGERALTFYTDFANPRRRAYTWNQALDYSIDAFSEGKAAMTINYSYHVPTVRRKNPNLRFSVAPVPQISLENPAVNYANYWGVTVKASDNAQKTEEAWRFLVWLTQKKQSEKYLKRTRRPPARRDLVSLFSQDPDLYVLGPQSLTAHSWFQISDREMATYFADAIENVVTGKMSPRDALRNAETKTTVLLNEARRMGKLPKP